MCVCIYNVYKYIVYSTHTYMCMCIIYIYMNENYLRGIAPLFDIEKNILTVHSLENTSPILNAVANCQVLLSSFFKGECY